jgi:hypothetical protein
MRCALSRRASRVDPNAIPPTIRIVRHGWGPNGQTANPHPKMTTAKAASARLFATMIAQSLLVMSVTPLRRIVARAYSEIDSGEQRGVVELGRREQHMRVRVKRHRPASVTDVGRDPRDRCPAQHQQRDSPVPEIVR